MMEKNNLEIVEEPLQKINRETSKINWNELLPFFAKGMAIYVSHKVDLIRVATILSNDDENQFERWLKEGLVAHVTDDQASAWYEEKILVWAVVIKPWVLVQPIVD
ncbi:DUF2288 domain-containing protein [Gammaproteobacteria bacterium]|jgi:hypothetical protein|nr:DUF2288 domain-containing protein [Gammaproteobacteria bacterium]|tara:strand:+ start:1315 stop:1632 length:318 start_codon:yes stop_codon:yes gene_type:complete